MHYKRTGLTLGLAALLLGPNPLAQANASDDQESRSPEIKTNFSVKQVEQADIDGTGASMGYTEIAAGAEWQFLLIDLDHRSYDWQGHNFMGAAEPFSELTYLAPALQYYQTIGKQWGIWAKGTALLGFKDKLATEAITYNPQVITSYSVTPSLDLYCGAGVLYHPADTTFYPVFGLAWNKDKKKGLHGILAFPETALRYSLTEQLALKLDILWENRIYQLAEDNTVAAEGYIKAENLLPGLHLEYKPLDELLLSMGVRHYFQRQLTFFTQDEEELGAYEPKTSWAYLFKAEYSFSP
ncbi:MAG: hypothetical protein WGN25_03460 [Candidatus Electrothrix sp. GW3-4]|uniref:hypothetical protein n=1 Tax=Candidatus Electrothrix sp. GW3-4 TaxID=3126740 RepID=UPI0030D04AEB